MPYQGESVRSSSQRQSAGAGIMTQAGRPMAPARWATALSTVMTRSRFCISAAVSPKSVRLAPWSVMPARAKAGRSASGDVLLQADQGDPGDLRQGLQHGERDGAADIVGVGGAAGPEDADLHAGGVGQADAPGFDARRVGLQIGGGGGGWR